ncbi:MAG: hypothetical protein ACREIC_05165, partial [Limisphaerales bacterium]
MTVTLQPGNILAMSNGNITLQYNLNAGTADCFWQNTRRITAFYAGVGLNTGYVKGLAFSNRTYTVTSANEVVVSSVAAGLPAMAQHFILDQTDSFLTRVDMSGASVSANWMGPVVVDTTGGVDLGSYTDERALFVPFDNDHFIRYNAMPLNSSGTSYEVGEFYDNASRIGLVVG